MDIKNEILWRLYAVMLVLVGIAMLIFFRAAQIQTDEGDKWRAKNQKMNLAYRPVIAERGSIIADDGSLLATSIPFYEIRFDTRASGLDDSTFHKNIDTLSKALFPYIQDRYETSEDFKNALIFERASNNRYVFITRNIEQPALQKIRQFPIFEWGTYRGGFIVERQSKRKRPFGIRARRTIGYVRKNAKSIGLEGAFNETLAGQEGKQLMQKVPGNYWIPVNDVTEIEPKRGQDVKTTIDVNVQDVAENALMKAVQRHNAKHGCAIVMEVQTGKIRAIANIGKTPKGEWVEDYNHAIADATEPGSTFKLAAIMALLEDKKIKLNDTIRLELGKTSFFEEEMVDASYHLLDSTTIRKAFEISSNVGIAKLTHKYYNNNKENRTKFIERLRQFHLHQQVAIEIEGEGNPLIKDADKGDWSGTTIPWMSIGYEVRITPLQLLAFYNAVANEGRMMKPYLVSEVQRFGKTIRKFEQEVIDDRIAQPNTIAKVKGLLEAVVEKGTARNIRTNSFAIAGKTGTAQMNYSKFGRSKIQYQSSFAGYFPADNPVYSCIVVITDPKQNGFYGSEVAAPVFREIAVKSYAKEIDVQPYRHDSTQVALKGRLAPQQSIGYKKDFETIYNYLDIDFQRGLKGNWTVTRADTLPIMKMKFRSEATKGVMPNVVGMGVRDAVFVLENLGLEVNIRSTQYGRVIKQSIPSGKGVRRGARVFLQLG